MLRIVLLSLAALFSVEAAATCLKFRLTGGSVDFATAEAAVAAYCSGSGSPAVAPGYTCTGQYHPTGTSNVWPPCVGCGAPNFPTVAGEFSSYIVYEQTSTTKIWAVARVTALEGVCDPECPDAGESGGIQNFTVGWALGPTPDANDVVGGTVDWNKVFDSELCITGCKVKYKLGGSTTDCWRGVEPSTQGLYRISCDADTSHTGQTCTSTPAESLASPTHSSPVCPTGNVGTVNGKSVCLGTVPASGVNFGRPNVSGNPQAGTSPAIHTNEQREPSPPTGGPGPEGGPYVSKRPDGGVGTGSNRTTGTGPNTGDAPPLKIDFPDDYARENTQQTIAANTTALKDDVANANTEGASAKGQIDGAKDSMASQYGDTTKMGLPSESSSPYAGDGTTTALPTTLSNWLGGTSACTTMTWDVGPPFNTFVVDPCPWLAPVKAVLDWAVVAFAVLTSILMVLRPAAVEA